jgi:hypothetical protein
MVQAFENCRVHLACLLGFVSVAKIKKIETPPLELIENFHVSGISIKTGEDPGVVISGHVITPYKKAGIINTPFTRFEEGEETAYKFTEDLFDKVQRVVAEVKEYLQKGKKADDPQQALPFVEAGQPSQNGTKNRDIEDISPELVGSESDPVEVWADGQRPKL